MKVLTVQDLERIRKTAKEVLALREESNRHTEVQTCGLANGCPHLQVLICGGTGCKASSSAKIAENFKEEIARQQIEDKIDIVTTGCFGFCEKGPIVKIIPDNTFYIQVSPEDVHEIVQEHLIGGRKLDRLLYQDPVSGNHVSDSKHMDFYRKQMRIALRNCGFIDPENIHEYIARDGYQALADCLLKYSREEVIDKIKKSGLRGRGGGGFPTGLKWEFTAKQEADQKYVVCNADEGDPGAFMDRSIMEGDPNSVIEAMAICGYAVGANKGLVYIRAEYPLAIQRLRVAIQQATDMGMLGPCILGSDFSFDIEIRYGAGAFVCGEETALIHSMEGKRGEPTLKPPFPAESGYLSDMFVRLSSGYDRTAVVSHIKEIISKVEPEYPTEVLFYDNVAAAQYQRENSFANTMLCFSIIAIIFLNSEFPTLLQQAHGTSRPATIRWIPIGIRLLWCRTARLGH